MYCSSVRPIIFSFSALCLLLNAIGDSRAADIYSPGNPGTDSDYVFDPALFKGGGFDQSVLQNLTQPDAVAPGRYKLDVFVNQDFIGSYAITFISHQGKVVPCLDETLINAIGFKDARHNSADASASCVLLSQVAPSATAKVALSNLRMTLSIPQAMLNVRPRGYVSPENYDTGGNIGFVNYLTNVYRVSYSGSNQSDHTSSWVSLNGGVNFATWQYRQQSSMSWDQSRGYSWNNLRSYVQRPFPALNSQFMAGQMVTNGRFFSGMDYDGINIATADAMLPDSLRGYAPVIKGIATSNAKVTVRQNGHEIYQTTVAPGAFEINDLYPTSYSGDLEVKVTEADGTLKTFIVPFSAVPESMRPGLSRYNLAIGKTRNMQTKTTFADWIYQRGLTNAVTANGGLRAAENYQAAVLGGVHASRIGAIGLDATFSRAKIRDNTLNGWMGHLSWSKTFQPTYTTVSLAGYRYSTSGYRDLSDVLGMRTDRNDVVNWMNFGNSQRERLDLSLSQSLGTYGDLFVSGATQNYRNGRSRDTQLQLGYSKTLPYNINMNLAVSRQRSGGYDEPGQMETATSVSFSIPLFPTSERSVSLSTSWTHSNSGGDQLQSTASGMMDSQQTTSYSLSATQDQRFGQTTVAGNLQRRFSKVNAGVNVSKGQNYWQAAGNAQGAFAVHSEGITFGPYLGDTFALVEAKGAEGAHLFNTSQATIDSQGFALVPVMTPYRYNNISLDPQGMQGNAEILDSQKRVAPVAGAAIRVKFRTQTGTALLIKSLTADGEAIPMGAQVYDAQHKAVGIAGQGGQIYVRVEQPKGKLWIQWEAGQQCALTYDLTKMNINQPLVTLTSRCLKTGEGKKHD